MACSGIRVALVTCYDKFNYGSMLQAWATQRYLAQAGFDVRTVDKEGLKRAISHGRKDYYAQHRLDVPMYTEKAPFAFFRIRKKIDPLLKHRMSLRKAAFTAFEKQMFRLTRRVFNFNEAKELSKEYDVVLVGSDQLWLPVNIAGNYFTLSWVDSTIRKVSYATSFGIASLNKHELKQTASFLDSFGAVSVREKSGADIVFRASGQKARVVCDPTMLLTRDEWLSVAHNNYDGIPREPYIFTYFMGRNAWQRKIVESYAKAKGLKIVAIAHNDSYIRADEGYADYYLWDVGPSEWLALISNAELVCTDSFHGTVFSNIFQVPFVSFRRHVNEGAQSTNSRMDNLHEVLGHTGRICESVQDFSSIAEELIDYASVQTKLEYYREESGAWLKTALKEDCSRSQNHIEIVHKEDCCGCSACAAICPKGCIKMDYDEEGCEYPVVDNLHCVSCKKCLGVCPVINAKPEVPKDQRAFLVQHRNSDVLSESTSGGAMTALAQVVLSHGGIVFGAGYLNDSQMDRVGNAPGRLKVGHFGIEREEELWRFRNSKYVQSSLGPTMVEIQQELSKKRDVLFIGTPCQAEGLLSYLGGHPNNLYIADVVCHAVACRAVFSSYIQWLDSKYDISDQVLFRDKTRYGYEYSNMRATKRLSDNKHTTLYSAGVESDPYLRAFFSNLSDRLICYQCPFKKRYRLSDITCWDCFDIHKFSQAFNDNRGVTRLLVHNAHGEQLFNEARDFLIIQETNADNAVDGVRELTCPVNTNPNRTAFMSDVTSLQPDKIINKWLADTLAVKANRFARSTLEAFGIYSQTKFVVKKLIGR